MPANLKPSASVRSGSVFHAVVVAVSVLGAAFVCGVAVGGAVSGPGPGAVWARAALFVASMLVAYQVGAASKGGGR